MDWSTRRTEIMDHWLYPNSGGIRLTEHNNANVFKSFHDRVALVGDVLCEGIYPKRGPNLFHVD